MILIILAVVLIIKLIQNNKSKTVSSIALDNLKAKFANGDISEEEYLNRKNILENK
jgi:putative membrane protein